MRLTMLPVVFLLMPLVEIAGFILVGKVLGLGLTLVLVVLSFVGGLLLLRRQGIGILRQLQAQSRQGHVPARELLQPAVLVVAALLLIIPGFVSDIFALLLLIPAVREGVWRFLSKRFFVARTTAGQPHNGTYRPSDPKVVDLDADDYRREPDPKSPWSGKRLGE